MRKFNKKKLPSRHTSLGPDKAPQRSFYYAMKLTEKDVAKPFVGVVSTWNEAAPCNIALMRQAQSVKKGVKSSGGTPREFCTITVTDGIAMGHEGMKSSLVSRDVIADSTELTVRGHCYDALVGVAGCDKSLPGLMMAMVRLNVPSVFIYGGSILPGRFNGKDVTVVDVFEGVGKYSSGQINAHALRKLELKACPSAGACGGQFTANTMACVSEAMGLALPYSAGTPAPYEQRDKFALQSGKAVMNLLAKNIRPRDIVTRKALENAATIVAATGGSTNAGLHLPAIAHECGIKFDLDDVVEIFKRTPYLADLKPGGQYVAKDVYEAGGVPISTAATKGILGGAGLIGGSGLLDPEPMEFEPMTKRDYSRFSMRTPPFERERRTPPEDYRPGIDPEFNYFAKDGKKGNLETIFAQSGIQQDPNAQDPSMRDAIMKSAQQIVSNIQPAQQPRMNPNMFAANAAAKYEACADARRRGAGGSRDGRSYGRSKRSG